jgi:hypothetical protein
MKTSTLGFRSPAALSLGVAVALGSPLAACSSSSSTGGADGGGGEDSSFQEAGQDGPGSTTEGGGEDALSDQGSTDATPPGDARDGAADAGGGHDSATDTGSCDATNVCVTAQCCPRPNQSCGSFTMTGDNVVDSTTHLTWQRSFADQTDYATASADCAAWGGRLPTQAELTSYAQARSTCSAQLLWATPYTTECVWSSTAYSGGGAHYCVFYNGAPAGTIPDGDTQWVQCVK